VPAHRLDDPVRRDLGLVDIRLGKEHRELVPADPRQEIRLPDAVSHGARHALQKVVARLVAEGVVDVLEVVQVDHENGARGAVARHPLGLTGELLLETAPVDEPRQEVVIGQVLEALRQLLALGDVLNLGNEMERPAPIVPHERHSEKPPDVVAPGMAIALLNLVAGSSTVEQFP
jgi:hypothetical protein